MTKQRRRSRKTTSGSESENPACKTINMDKDCNVFTSQVVDKKPEIDEISHILQNLRREQNS